jgi:hypothetical protein
MIANSHKGIIYNHLFPSGIGGGLRWVAQART